MTSQTGKNRHGWRRAITGGVASSALALGLLMGFGSPATLAQPETDSQGDASPTEQAEVPQTADEVLAIIARDYDLGAGGGQLSNFIHEVLVLRSLGFMPSKANKDAIVEALEHRPNQTPLVEALKETVSYQRTLQARAEAAGAPPGGFVAGINQLPPGQTPDPTDPDNTGVFLGPTGGITQPIG
jgi:hypothetical protein